MSAEINDIINAKPSAEGSNVVNAENSTVTNIDKPKEVKEVLAKGEKPWGYDLYPERRGTFKKQWKNIFFGSEGSEAFEKIKCEKKCCCYYQEKSYGEVDDGSVKKFWMSHRYQKAHFLRSL